MTSPVLSVIIPCYNNGIYLAEMLDCCLRQTYHFWEVIIVDDGSTDNTPDIIKEYTNKDNRILFYSRDREPKGSLTCRNIGFSHSKGKYIIHFDADDIITDTCFEQRVVFMDSHPECDYATFKARNFRILNGKQVFSKGISFGELKVEGDVLTGLLSSHYPFSIWNNIYHRNIVERYPWDEKVKVYSDFSYAIPMVLDGVRQVFSDQPEPDYLYRQFQGGTNMSASAINEDKCESTLYLFKKTLDALSLRQDKIVRFKEFFEFIVLHFRRMLIGRKFKEADSYIEMLSSFYSKERISKMSSILNRVKDAPAGRFYPIRVYYHLYHSFKYSFDKTMFVHLLGKLLLGYSTN